MKSTLRICFLALILAVASSSQEVQAQIEIGPEIGLNLDGANFFAGVNVAAPLEAGGLPVKLNGIFDYYFVGDDNIADSDVSSSLILLEGGANLFVAEQDAYSPYVGLGLAFSRASVSAFGDSTSSSNFGLLLKGGAEMVRDSNLTPFAEIVYYFDGGQLALRGGFKVSIGG